MPALPQWVSRQVVPTLYSASIGHLILKKRARLFRHSASDIGSDMFGISSRTNRNLQLIVNDGQNGCGYALGADLVIDKLEPLLGYQRRWTGLVGSTHRAHCAHATGGHRGQPGNRVLVWSSSRGAAVLGKLGSL